MKTTLLIWLFLVTYTSSIFGSSLKELTGPIDPSPIKYLVFYGYDISYSKITDPKRSGVDLARYMLELVGELQVQVDERRLVKWSKATEVTLNHDALYAVNRQVKSPELFYPNYRGESKLTKDSIQKIISLYNISEKDGTGFVILFEFLSKERKSVSGYGCLFDIKSRRIINLMHHESYDSNGYNSFRDYWVPATKLVRTFCEQINGGQ